MTNILWNWADKETMKHIFSSDATWVKHCGFSCLYMCIWSPVVSCRRSGGEFNLSGVHRRPFGQISTFSWQQGEGLPLLISEGSTEIFQVLVELLQQWGLDGSKNMREVTTIWCSILNKGDTRRVFILLNTKYIYILNSKFSGFTPPSARCIFLYLH